MKKMKNISALLLVLFGFGIVGCNQADGKLAETKKINGLVQTKLDSLTKELAADCDKQIASAVKAKAATMAAIRAASTKAGAPAPKPAQQTTTQTTPEPTSKVKAKGKLSGAASKTGKVIEGAGQRVKNTVNKNFDPAKKKKSKLSGKK